jgi:hypothetical protein
MGAHYDQVRLHRLSGPQDPIEGVSRKHARTAGDLLQFRDRPYLLAENASGLTHFESYQVLRLVVVNYMDESQFRPVLPCQQTCPSQGPLGAR